MKLWRPDVTCFGEFYETIKIDFTHMRFNVLSMTVLFCVSFVNAQKYEDRANFYYKVQNYGRAIKDFEREIKKQPVNEDINAKLADCYLSSNIDKAAALPYTTFMVKTDSTSETVLNQAKALFYNQKFDEALVNLDWVKRKSKPDDDDYKEAVLYESWLQNARVLLKHPLDVTFINLGSEINTKMSEINPYVSPEEDVLLFSSDKRFHSYAGVNYFNVYLSLRSNNEWSKLKTAGKSINSPYDEMIAGFMPEDNKVFIFHNQKGTEKVGVTDYLGKTRFTELEDLEKTINSKGGHYGVWLTPSKDTILFSAETKEGDLDLYYSIKLPEGNYGEPRELSQNINTTGDENFPVLTNDGKRLYFSSNGSASMGGADLFYSDYDENKKEWSKPINMGYPVNDMYDNFTITWASSERYAYVSAVRPEGYGERDIYKIVFKEKPAAPMIIKAQVLAQCALGDTLLDKKMNVELLDSISGHLVGEYKCTGDSANFVMILNPGHYKVNFMSNKVCCYSQFIYIPEMWFNAIPEKWVFRLPKPQENVINEN